MRALLNLRSFVRPHNLSLLILAAALAAGPALGAAATGLSLSAVAEAVGPEDARRSIASLAARASANGPRGAFTSEIVSLAEGDVRFRLRKGDATTDRLLLNGEAWARDAASGPFAPAEAGAASFIRGHEVHRILLELDRRFRPDARPAPAGCLSLIEGDSGAATLCTAADTGLPKSLTRELPEALGGGTIVLEFGDWRTLHRVRLPFAVDFVRAGERHTYRYSALLPFRLAPGAPLAADPATRFERLGDLAELAAQHERVMEAHRRSDLAMLLGAGSGPSTISSRGRLTERTREETALRLGPYLETIRFSRYEDVVVPVAALSLDGTLGWLACQIEAEGTQRPGASKKSEPIAYGFSWVELYAREGDSWRSLGNASSELE